MSMTLEPDKVTDPPKYEHLVKLSHGRVFTKPIDDIKPAPENDKLYRPPDQNAPDIVALADSILIHGQMEPCVSSVDGYLLSGHRRHAACRRAGLKTIKVRFEPISRADDPDGFLVLLREYNRQRVKSLDEQLREAVLSINPDDAYEALIEHREAKARVQTKAIEIIGTKTRCRISEAKTPFLNAIIQIVRDREEFWPISDRSIHYPLLNDPPLKHASKPDSIYRNDKASYNALTELLTRMRIAGILPYECIGDETRPVLCYDGYRDPSTFLEEQFRDFLTGYYRNLQQSQPNHIELICEKNTIQPMCKPIAAEYCLPLTSGRGFCSLQPRYEMVKRFKASGKEKLVVLIASDHDPEGEEIAHSFARSLRDDFGVEKIHAIKVALNHDQVERFNLPVGGLAKAGSVNRPKFVKKFGENVYELEALEPKTLQEILRESIRSVLDIDAFNHELTRERDDATKIAAYGRVARESLATLAEGSVE